MTAKKIKNNKKYLIDGWAVYCMIDVVKFIKSDTEKNNKKYSKKEFLDMLKTYTSVIEYLLNLKNHNDIETKDDIYNGDELSEAWKDILGKMKIKFDGSTKKDENDK